jgi:AcrR family transcriptional regulator
MQALDLAIRNFAVAEHLLHLQELFTESASFKPEDAFSLALCEELNLPKGTALHHVKNKRAVLGVLGSVTLPSCLTTNQGLDFLLRQAVVVSCSALESFIWDILRENALTVIRAKGRRADDTLKKITLTLDDYLSLEGYEDPDERLRQIILQRFERGALYDLEKVSEIMAILNVRDFWKEVTSYIGVGEKEVKDRLTDLIQRRNHIAHRADRPDENTSGVASDAHGLRPITHAWVSMRVANAKAFVNAAASSVEKAIETLEQIIAQREEQKLAQQTLA